MSDLPSQYTEEVETFRQILDLPDPRETLPGSSTTVLGLDHEKGQQELRPRGPSAMLPLNPILKDAFEKFEQNFLASNLPRIPPRFSPCKTHSREMSQTSGFDPTAQVKTCFDCKIFDVANWVARLNGEDGPGGTPLHEALSVSSQEALEISSVAGQPPSLDRNDFCTSRLVTESCEHDERRRPSSQRPQYPTLYRRLK